MIFHYISNTPQVRRETLLSCDAFRDPILALLPLLNTREAIYCVVLRILSNSGHLSVRAHGTSTMPCRAAIWQKYLNNKSASCHGTAAAAAAVRSFSD